MLHGRQTIVTLITLALAIVLGACGGPGKATELPGAREEAKPLDGTEWVLTLLNGHSPVEGFTITLAFPEKNYLQGNAGCNSYGARYASDSNGFTISEGRIDRTDFACDVPESVRQQEVTFFEALANAATHQETDGRLAFENATGEPILMFALEEEPPIDPALEDTEWVLTSLNGSSLLEGTTITLNFAAEFLEGFAGCNAYGGGRDSGKYMAADEGILTIPEIAITLQDCHVPEGVMQQEAAYIEALRNAASYRVIDDRLEIDNAAGETVLIFSRKEEFPMDPGDLVGTAWRLRSWNGDSPIEDSTITLAFHDEYQASGHAGCRGYVATYKASGDDIGFHWLAMLGPFEGCSEALMEQEGQYTTVFGWATDYRFSESQLELLTARGEVLVFKPLPENANPNLERTAWALVAFIEEKVVEGMPTPLLMPTDLLAETEITAAFEDGTVSGSAGCNSYGAAFAQDGASVNIETPAATEMACLSPAGVMEQEQRYLAFLRDVTAYRIHGNQLWLETDDGRALVFISPTPAPPTPTAIISTATPTQPTLTPAGRDCTGPNAFPIDEAELMWPELRQVQPDRAAPGDKVEIRGVGGNLYWENECGKSWLESARDFQLFLDDAPAGFINCYASMCLTNLIVPLDTLPGPHTISAEGGSSLSVKVSGQ